ncbi:MAG TPA: DNA translocase FtsK 4TM domain-containing protein, partial [Orrella sp.]
MSKTTAASARSGRAARSSRNVRNGPSPLQLRLLSFLREARWVLFALLAAWLALVLVTWSPADPGWSHSASQTLLSNGGGVLGAYTADILYYLLGFSAWWLVVLLLHRVYAGYRRLVHHLRAQDDQTLERVKWEQGVGFGLVLAGSVGLESLRLGSWGQMLPSHTELVSGAGGVIGYAWSSFLNTAVGFTGSTLILIALLVIGLGLFFGFSWLTVCERVGTWIEMGVLKVYRAYQARVDRRAGEAASAERHEHV